MSEATTTEVENMISTLRAKADFLATHQEILARYDFQTLYDRDGYSAAMSYVSPYNGYGRTLDLDVTGPESPAIMAELRRAIGGMWKKEANDYRFSLTRDFHQSGVNLSIVIASSRESVCTRVVTGTETVVIPAVEAQPERVEERDKTEWRCSPILDDDDPAEENYFGILL